MPDPAQVAIAELQARTALHHIGADLGETITVETDANGRVLVEGITEDESRKQQIADALKDIRFTDLRIESVQQMAVQQVPAARPLRSVIVAGVGSPLLEEQLKQQFPNASERMEYVNRSLDLCQRASARAWALNRLADRYTAKQVALLPEEEQHELQNLLIEHISTLQEDVERLRNQLAPVVSFTSNSATAGDAEVGRSPGASLPGGNARSDDWRDRIHRIHASVETANEAATSLLAGTTEDGDTSDKLQLNLDSAVNRLRLELQLLDKQVRRGL